jgi:phage terminase large subunit GpA-like protein
MTLAARRSQVAIPTGARHLYGVLAEACRPRKLIPTAQFAETSFYLPRETSEIHGRFSLHYAPALSGIFAAMDDPQISEVVAMKSAQQGWTTALIAYLANRIVNAPCAMIGPSSGVGPRFAENLS